MLQRAAIAILSFDHPELTARAVRAAVSALTSNADDGTNDRPTTERPTTPIFLLHNGSTADHETSLRGQFRDIDHLTLTTNRGYSGGANFLLQNVFGNATIDWALLLTNDCELHALTEQPTEPGLYAPLIYRRSTAAVDSIGGLFRPWSGRLRHIRSEGEARVHLDRQPPRQFNPSHFYVPGTAFWVHRSTWQKLGGFDETLHTYWEDVDLSVRARRKNLALGVHSTTKIIHGVGKTCHKIPFYTRYLFQRNRRTICARYSPPYLRWWLTWSWR